MGITVNHKGTNINTFTSDSDSGSTVVESTVVEKGVRYISTGDTLPVPLSVVARDEYGCTTNHWVADSNTEIAILPNTAYIITILSNPVVTKVVTTDYNGNPDDEETLNVSGEYFTINNLTAKAIVELRRID